MVTTDNQLGFKHSHATDLCIFLVKETIQYYKANGSSIFLTFLDASKAFDRVNHGTLFQCLLNAMYHMFTGTLTSYFVLNGVLLCLKAL